MSFSIYKHTVKRNLDFTICAGKKPCKDSKIIQKNPPECQTCNTGRIVTIKDLKACPSVMKKGKTTADKQNLVCINVNKKHKNLQYVKQEISV